jgi:diguanylate cyclase (GGDEF)-like protein
VLARIRTVFSGPFYWLLGTAHRIRRWVPLAAACVSHPRAWALWQARGPFVRLILAVDAVALTVIVVGLSTAAPLGRDDWAHWVALMICAGIHLVWSHRHEETRRESKKVSPNVDWAGIWSVAALLVLPVPLTVALVVVVRLVRWFVARKPLHRYLFSTGSILFSAIVTTWFVRAIGVQVGHTPGLVHSTAQLLLMIAAGVLYAVIQAALVGVAFVLSTPDMPLSMALGSRAENTVSAVSAPLGALAAIALVTSPAAVLVVSGIAVACTKYTSLNQDATYDLRTGLLNHSAWEQQAGRAIAQAQRSHAPCSVMFIDADKFKLINDTYGHPAGDAVLRALGDVLRRETRRGDLAARFGGEELVVLLPDTGPDQAAHAAERIRHVIGELSVPTTNTRGAPVILLGRDTPLPVDAHGAPQLDGQGRPVDADCRTISVSIGVATASGPDISLESLTAVADAAVYAAKQNGRNQVKLSFPKPEVPAPRPPRAPARWRS